MGFIPSERNTFLPVSFMDFAISTACAKAEAPSYMLALATSIPVSSHMSV